MLIAILYCSTERSATSPEDIETQSDTEIESEDISP